MNIENVINAYGIDDIRLDIEERDDEIELLVKYDDHGDDFVVVKTIDGEFYEYGFYKNLKYYDESSIDIRKPVMFCDEDEGSYLSNKLFFAAVRSFGDPLSKPKKGSIYGLDSYLRELEEAHESNVFYNVNRHKRRIIRFLEYNNLLNDENLAKLDNAKFDSKIDGFNGIAGKKTIDGEISGDNIKLIIYKGEEIDPNDCYIPRNDDVDEWGYDSFYLDLNRFENPNEIKDVTDEEIDIIKQIASLLEKLNENPSSYELEDKLDSVRMEFINNLSDYIEK